MRAFVLTHYGQSLELQNLPRPEISAQQVLVSVRAAGLNQLDERLRQGEFKQLLPYKTPQTMGYDLAGVVIAVGSAVASFQPGDEVFARVGAEQMGTFAEFAAVEEAHLALRPRTASMTESGSLPLVALTAWQALVERARVAPGQKVLIHAGAGGVGTVAIQLAKHLGAFVATTASASNADFLRELGADLVIDYRSEDFEEKLSGYDAVLDSLGGENLEKSLRILKPGGRAIGISGPPDPAFAKAFGLNPVMRLAITGLSAKVRRQAKKLGVSYEFLFMEPSGDQLREIAALVDSGAIQPVVGAEHPFEETAQALESLGRGGLRGKAVVVIPPAEG